LRCNKYLAAVSEAINLKIKESTHTNFTIRELVINHFLASLAQEQLLVI